MNRLKKRSTVYTQKYKKYKKNCLQVSDATQAKLKLDLGLTKINLVISLNHSS